MKNLVISILLCACVVLLSCEKQKIENPQVIQAAVQNETGQINQSGQNISNDLNFRDMNINGYLHGEWHCEINDSTSIVLNIDTASNTFSAFSERWNELSGLLMGDGSVEHYYMNGDTLFVTQIDDMQYSQNVTFPWLIRRISPETMEMFYLGFLPQGGIIHKIDYLYNR